MAADQGEENDERTIRISTSGDYIRTMNSEGLPDPFAIAGEDLGKLKGISSNTKRRMNREIQKAKDGSTGVLVSTQSGMTGGGGTTFPTQVFALPNTGAGDAKSKKLEPVEVTAYAMFNVVQPTYNLDYLGKLYEVNSAHFAAVNAKISNVVGLGYDFIETAPVIARYEEIPDNESERLQRFRRKIAKTKQQLTELIYTLNNDDSFLDVLKKMYSDLEITGNGFIEIGRKSTGEIGYIGHIPSTTMRVRRRRDGFVQIVNYRVQFFRNFGDTETPDQIGDDPQPNEVIHFKKYTPVNYYYGIPDVIPSVNALAGDSFASKFNLDYFENKAVPRYIITVKGAKLSVESERRLLEFFQTNVRGTNHRTLYIPLPADEGTSKVEFKMEPVEAGVQDSSFHTYRQDNKLEILMAHRVPVSKVTMMPGVSLANSRDADKTFREQVTRPIQQDLEFKINKIIKEFTDIFILKFNELTLTDEDTQSKIDERYLRMQVKTPNEVRSKIGLPPRDGGDEVVVLNAQARAEQTEQATRNRVRDQERSANASDSDGEARNPQGEGRQAR
jgi:PBSX family phage portal protein